jgi:chitodextrinase/pimeloyl-ACP methyl ester carboxylesterase
MNLISDSKVHGLFVMFVFTFLLAGAASAATYQMPYYSDGLDHFYSPTIYLTSGGTHTFSVNGVPNAVWPWTSNYNYVWFKDSGSGYTQIGSSSTTTGWDPSLNISVNPGNKVKLVIRTGTTIGSGTVTSVYYWYIYQANRAPTQPGALSASSITKTGATVSWGASSDLDGDTITYEVQYGKTYAIDGWTSAGTTTGTSKVLSGLASDTTYTIRVIARDGKGGESSWQPASGLFTTLKENRAPTQPGTLSASSITKTGATVSWGASSDPDGDTITYEVQYGKTYAIDGWTSAGTTTGTSKVLSGLASDTTYTVRVIARDGKEGGESSWREASGLFTTSKTSIISVAAKINGKTGPVEADFGSTVTGSGIITGTGAGNVTYHWEYTSPSNSSWTRVSPSDSSVTMTSGQATVPSTNLITLNQVGSYNFKIVVTSPSTLSSPLVTVSTKDGSPNKPGRLWVEKVTNNSATIHWGASTVPDGGTPTYEVLYKGDWNPTWLLALKITGISDTKQVIDGLESEKTYDVRVIAKDAKGGESDPCEKQELFKTHKKAAMTPSADPAKNGFYGLPGDTPDILPLNGRIPVILVHGAGSDERPATMNYWFWWGEEYFNNARYNGMFKVYRYVYDSSKHISDNGTAFANFVNKKLSGQRVLIMAHSMGGLVARYALNTDTTLRGNTIKLITLGTPHLGSPGADPSWVIGSSGSILAPKFWNMFIYLRAFEGISEGDYDLAWYNKLDFPPSAWDNQQAALDTFACKDSLLYGSMDNPFAGSTQITATTSDSKIMAFGGYVGSLFGETGLGDNFEPDSSNPVDANIGKETHLLGSDRWSLATNHDGLREACDAMATVKKSNGDAFTYNDGFVPLESALCDIDVHDDIDRINITNILPHNNYIDHVCYLDKTAIMDYIMSYIWEIAVMPDLELPADNAVLNTLTPSFTWSSYDGFDDGHGHQLGYQLVVLEDGSLREVYNTGFVDSPLEYSHIYQSPGSYSGYDSVAQCDQTSEALQWDMTYHWFVRYRIATDWDSHWGPWSPVDPVPANDEQAYYRSFTTATGAGAPGQATNPTPANRARGVSVTTDLSWTAGSGANSHDVYFGTVSPGTYRGDQTEMTYDTGTMANNTTYYWRIDEKNDGDTITGNVWSFTTESRATAMTITKCTVTAGKKVNSDKISFSGTMDAIADDLSAASSIEVTIDSDDMVSPCILTFPINNKTWKVKKGKYSYSGTESRIKKSFTYDLKTHKFSFAASNVDLCGLTCPLTVQIKINSYVGAAEVGESVVNGPRKPIPIFYCR